MLELGWIDFSKEYQSKVMSILDLLTEPGRMSLFSLMYPSITLAKLFNTIDILDNGEGIESRNKVDKLLTVCIAYSIYELI